MIFTYIINTSRPDLTKGFEQIHQTITGQWLLRRSSEAQGHSVSHFRQVSVLRGRHYSLFVIYLFVDVFCAVSSLRNGHLRLVFECHHSSFTLKHSLIRAAKGLLPEFENSKTSPFVSWTHTTLCLLPLFLKYWASLSLALSLPCFGAAVQCLLREAWQPQDPAQHPGEQPGHRLHPHSLPLLATLPTEPLSFL